MEDYGESGVGMRCNGHDLGIHDITKEREE
jgi:hypothetical protein